MKPEMDDWAPPMTDAPKAGRAWRPPQSHDHAAGARPADLPAAPVSPPAAAPSRRLAGAGHERTGGRAPGRPDGSPGPGRLVPRKAHSCSLSLVKPRERGQTNDRPGGPPRIIQCRTPAVRPGPVR